MAKPGRSRRRWWRSCPLRLWRLWLQRNLKRNQWRCMAARLWEGICWELLKTLGAFQVPFFVVVAFLKPVVLCGIQFYGWFPWVYRACTMVSVPCFRQGKANQKTLEKLCRCRQRCQWMYHPTRQGSWGWRNSKVSRHGNWRIARVEV